MIIKFFFLILIIFKICNCFKHNYFCVLNDYKNLICKKQQCGENICSKDKESCRNLKKWSDIVDKYNPKLNEKKTDQFFRFFSELKECTRTDYINLPAIVCSNKVKCNKENQGFFRYMIGLKPKECFCSGKLKYDCGNEYCVANKIICGDLFESNKNSTFLSKKIKNCI